MTHLLKLGCTMRIIIFIFSICLLFSACKQEKDVTFYHWKTLFQPNQIEQNALDALNPKKLYVHYFDVDWSDERNMPVPSNPVLHARMQTKFEVVPTVFITNKVFEKIQDTLTKYLAARIIEQIKINGNAKEIQIDCDWNSETKNKYFSFLKELKEQNKSKISATIRLHQVKYADQTGVPPVDRGILMFYNMSAVEKNSTKNSILDTEVAKSYLQNFEKYPLELDLALPIFSWGVLFRDGELIDLLNSITESSFSNTEYYQKLDEKHIKVLKSTYFNGKYLYANDEIRLEDVTKQQLKEAYNLIKPLLKKNKHLTIAFFDLQKKNLERFSPTDLKEIVAE